MQRGELAKSANKRHANTFHGEPPGCAHPARCLVDHVGANLADQRVLIACATAASNGTDELATLDQWEPARRRRKRWIERSP